MTSTVLEIVNDALIAATSELAVTTTPDEQRAILRMTAREFLQRRAWQKMAKEASFTSVAGETQVENITEAWPDLDYLRPETFFNRTQQRQVITGLTSKEWAALKGSSTQPLDYLMYLRGDTLLALGSVPVGDTITFEYLSKNWLRSADGSQTYDRVAADNDVVLLDDEAMTQGLRWRMLQRRGLEYGEAMRAYENRVAHLESKDTPVRDINSQRGPQINLEPFTREGGWAI